ncbi:MAG TPA: hypothetical protein VE954_37495 [Oligoflexus sp.]|uniref:hypothetical protein n=1 Tax=Oligoflexus sp. TaxID=1971216 RepID=UPI002D5D3AEE|nr:hypothetical protein [Oligoflexus sp.]HYX38835.1 hypothetical protein [Oligoflexus sp.]
MKDELKAQLFSGVLLKTKSEPYTSKRHGRMTFGDLLFAVIVVAAAAGLVMFLLPKLKSLL